MEISPISRCSELQNELDEQAPTNLFENGPYNPVFIYSGMQKGGTGPPLH